MDALLDRVFDEYGLLVCGWSAEWDFALRAALERCPTRRYGMFWTVVGKPGESASRLISHRRAEVMTIKRADTFFEDVTARVQALSDMSMPDNVSPKVVGAMVKRYLADPAAKIRLHDLVSRETQIALRIANPARLPILGAISEQEYRTRVLSYEAIASTLRPITVAVVQWGAAEQQALWHNALKALARRRLTEGGLTALIGLRRYPALQLFYTAGLTMVAMEDFTSLRRLISGLVVDDPDDGEQRLGVWLQPYHVFADGPVGRVFEELKRSTTPVSDRLYQVLRDDLRELLPDEVDYDRAFDLFEYLWVIDLVMRDGHWFHGRYARRNSILFLRKQFERKNEEWESFRQGMFRNTDEFKKAKNQVDEAAFREFLRSS